MAKNQINFAVYLVLIVVAVLICAVAAWYATMFQSLFAKEAFEGFADTKEGLTFLSNSKENDCPLSAKREADGKIHVQPQNRSFDTMADYVAWLSSLSAAGSMCIPPYVKGPREVDVIQGGSSNTVSPPAQDRDTGVSPDAVAKQNTSRNVFTKQVEGEQTYAKTPINKVDDYEYTRIFQNEDGPRGQLSKTTVNSLVAKHQFDWSYLPFNSAARADAEDEFVAGRKDDAKREPKSGVFFRGVEGFEVNPPDTQGADIAEKAAIEPFVSKPPEKLLEHDTEEIGDLVKKMYADDPDWEPVVEKVGTNEYRVVELRPKPKKEKWAGNEENTIERAKEIGQVAASVEVEGGRQDPYFDKQGVLDYSNDRFWEYKDFKKWTPGLDRMFAPTLDTTNWS